jgi:hypothetical protein
MLPELIPEIITGHFCCYFVDKQGAFVDEGTSAAAMLTVSMAIVSLALNGP